MTCISFCCSSQPVLGLTPADALGLPSPASGSLAAHDIEGGGGVRPGGRVLAGCIGGEPDGGEGECGGRLASPCLSRRYT